MAKPRRRPRAGADQPAVRIPLSVVENPSRSELEAMSEAERAVWRELRSEAGRAAYCHREFDPRAVLTLEGDEREAWSRRRRARLVELFANDPRVDADS